MAGWANQQLKVHTSVNVLLITAAVLLISYFAPVQAAPDTLYLSDEFSGPGEHFFFEGSLEQRVFKYIDGEYEIDTTKSTAYGQSVVLEPLSDYRIEAAAQLKSSTEANGGGFGLCFNYHEGTEENDFLLFMVYDRGAFTVLRYLGGTTTVLSPPALTDAFAPGTPAMLSVDVAGGSATCSINGNPVASISDTVLTSGGFGMFATAQSVVRFDDFKVYAAIPEAPSSIEDDFSGDKHLFEGEWGGVLYSYESGRYIVDTLASEFFGLAPFPGNAQDFEFSADVEMLDSESSGGYGLYVRDSSSASGGYDQFRFLMSGEWLAVEQSIGERPLALAEWARHDAVRTGSVNRLKVVCNGGDLTYFVNGIEVWHGEDASPKRGAFGFIAAGGLRVAFDNASYIPLD